MNNEVTVNDVMNNLSVSKNSAYGLVTFLVDTGLARKTGDRREPGKRGKGQTVYTLSERAHHFLQTLMNKESNNG